MTVRRPLLVVALVWATGSALLLFTFISYITWIVWLRHLLRYFLLYVLICQVKTSYTSNLKSTTGGHIDVFCHSRQFLSVKNSSYYNFCTFGLGLPNLLLAICIDPNKSQAFPSLLLLFCTVRCRNSSSRFNYIFLAQSSREKVSGMSILLLELPEIHSLFFVQFAIYKFVRVN